MSMKMDPYSNDRESLTGGYRVAANAKFLRTQAADEILQNHALFPEKLIGGAAGRTFLRQIGFDSANFVVQ